MRFVLVGIGMNVLNEPPDVGVSLRELAGDRVRIEDVLDDVLMEFDREYRDFLVKDYLFEG